MKCLSFKHSGSETKMHNEVSYTSVQRKSLNLDSVTRSQWSASRGSPASAKSSYVVGAGVGAFLTPFPPWAELATRCYSNLVCSSWDSWIEVIVWAKLGDGSGLSFPCAFSGIARTLRVFTILSSKHVTISLEIKLSNMAKWRLCRDGGCCEYPLQGCGGSPPIVAPQMWGSTPMSQTCDF
jgi:hypothetical protein